MQRESIAKGLSHGLRALYGDVAREPVPAELAGILDHLGNEKPGDAMGGRASPGVLTPGGQSSTP